MIRPSIAICSLIFLAVSQQPFVVTHAEEAFPRNAKRIVFFGDSITHAGHYISLIEAQWTVGGGHVPEMINLGLPSETCNGMSEPEHPFPRPNVHERLERALTKLKPDVVVACYGMNDGIYYPPAEKHFKAYKDGIDKIVKAADASGAKLILMTPPAFDDLPLRKKRQLAPLGEEKYSWKRIYENYDDVIRQFADHVKSQSDRVRMVIDLYGPVTRYVAEKRKNNPDFVMSPDGVHVNNEGHEVLAAAILKAWGHDEPSSVPKELLNLISKRQKLMHAAWLSEVGHVRPGVKEGLPIEKAKQQAKQIADEIENLTAAKS